MISKSKIVVIGAGNVGEAIAYTLMVRQLANEIVLLDINEERAQGSASDISHGTGFFRAIRVRKGDYSDCADAEIIVISAGIGRKPGQSRRELATTNVKIIKTVTKSIMQYAKNPIIIVVSNPLDVLTYTVWKESGLPANRVIGTGTSLDTARFRHTISKETGINVCDVDAYILGEHGDGMVPIYSNITIADEPLESFVKNNNCKIDIKEIGENTRTSGARIIARKGATFYGVAMATSAIINAIVHNENAVYPVSHVFQNEGYEDYEGIAISMPCVLNSDGISRVINLPMNKEEVLAMKKSAQVIRELTTAAISDAEAGGEKTA
jgi:L-lactate dehydrogenase